MNGFIPHTELLRELPAVKRFRGGRLYLQNGRKLLDFYREGGRAFFGYKPSGMGTRLKNVLDRGAWSGFPGKEEHRLIRLLDLYCPGYRWNLFRTETAALHYIAEQTGKSPETLQMQDSAFPCAADPDFTLHRPATPFPEQGEFILPLLPFPWGDSAVIVGNRREKEEPLVRDILSPVALTGRIQALHRLIEEPVSGDSAMDPGPLWEKNGRYFRWRGRTGGYSGHWRSALDRGILLPPDSLVPGVFPDDLSEGEGRQFSQWIAETGDLKNAP